MKIGIVCSMGGHLTEILRIMDAFKGHEVFFVTHRSPRTESLEVRKYFIRNLGNNYLKVALASLDFLRILLNERPSIIISTGSEIAIPAFYVARLLGISTIFIESWCCVFTPSGVGKLVYPVSDIFLVQWPTLLEKYGAKAKFVGAVI